MEANWRQPYGNWLQAPQSSSTELQDTGKNRNGLKEGPQKEKHLVNSSIAGGAFEPLISE